MTVAINGRFLLNSFGGVRRFGIELAERLSTVRDDVVLLAPTGATGDEAPSARLETFGRFSGPVWEQLELPRWLRRHGHPVLINPANIAPIGYANQVSVLHDIAPALRPQDFSRLFRWQWQLTVRLGMLRRGPELVSVSDASRREIADYFRIPPDRIDVIYNGADSLSAPLDSPEPASPYVLSFGRHGTAKNARSVIDAAAHLQSRRGGLAVHFVGTLDPALEPYSRAQDIDPTRLVWRGPVSDEELAAEYAGALAFVWPSLHEGFGIPPVEAQTLGIPVIASDIPINREILADTALYFPPTDPHALADAIDRIASDPSLRADLAGRGRENAQRFSWENTARAWQELIQRRESRKERRS